MRVEIRGTDLPGRSCFAPEPKRTYDNIHVGVQYKREAVDLVPGDVAEARWSFDIDVIDKPEGGIDFRGPHVQGKKGDRFFYLSWGTVDRRGTFEMFRRAKLMLASIDPKVLAKARKSGVLVGSLGLTMVNGTPLCAAVRPPLISWSAA